MPVAVFYEWEAEHGPLSGWELIEPVDGFHPNQVCPSAVSSAVELLYMQDMYVIVVIR